VLPVVSDHQLVSRTQSNAKDSGTMETISIIIPPKPGQEDSYPKDRPITMDISSHAMSSLGKDSDLPASKLPFTWKLYELLEDVEESGQDHIISWVNNGKGFRVHNLDLFVSDIIPIYFKQSKYKSFQRQLYFYDFKRVSKGAGTGSYYHPMFVRGNKTRCLSMTPKKNTSSSKKECVSSGKEEGEPMSHMVSGNVPSSSLVSITELDHREEPPRRVSLESPPHGQIEVQCADYRKREQSFSTSRPEPTAPALVSFTSEENSRHHDDRHQHRANWQRLQEEDEINDGAACSVFGSMIFRFVRGVPQF
jgi:HSF-type DNA-binding